MAGSREYTVAVFLSPSPHISGEDWFAVVAWETSLLRPQGDWFEHARAASGAHCERSAGHGMFLEAMAGEGRWHAPGGQVKWVGGAFMVLQDNIMEGDSPG